MNFFISDKKLWRQDVHRNHQWVIPPNQRYGLLKEAHNELGHKGIYLVRRHLVLQFWWLYMDHNIKWFICMCHKCQIQQTTKVHIPPTVPLPASLFQKVHIDMMLMPKAAMDKHSLPATSKSDIWASG